MLSTRSLASALTAMVVLAGGCGTGAEPASDAHLRQSATPSASGSGAGAATARRPLAGRVVVLDPGHQLGNRNFPTEINAPVDAGGFTKACNTTGTSTNDGYPEATFVWQVAQLLRRELERRGARVLLTRESDSDQAWGPCVDERGTIGNPGTAGPDADLRLSIHADGSLSDADRGFHVIRPGELTGWTDDIVRPSRRFARVVRDRLVADGFETSTYRGVDGIDARTDLGTLNLSDVPAVMVELGNMRNAEEAALMSSPKGRKRYATALAGGVAQMLRR